MKTLVILAAAVMAAVAQAGGQLSLIAGKVEVLVTSVDLRKNPAVRFAAEEMTNYLSRVLGDPVPIVTERGNAWTSSSNAPCRIVLGTNKWSVRAGVDVTKLKRDGYVILTKPDRIFIAGRDDPKFKPFDSRGYDEECGTLYGVYEFLERIAGCRFYFPGELGEVVPRRSSLPVPRMNRVFEPDWKVRHLPVRFGAWFEKTTPEETMRIDRLFRYRLRYQTAGVPSSHGLAQSKFSVRFGKDHPEYFQLKKGRRTNVWEDGKAQYYHSMLCHTSGIWDEIYRDARSYFLGEGPEVRGIVYGKTRNRFTCRWGWNVAEGKYYDAAPQDGMSKCECPNCQACYARAKDPKDWANELIWGNTVRLANRLTADGFRCYVTQIAYNPYKNVPDMDIPSNVLVKVVSNGPWVTANEMARNLEQIRAWNAKTDGRIWIWNNCGKHPCFNLNIRDYPSATPQAFASYYKSVTSYGFGACCDNSAERFLYSALDYYVFTRIAWDHATDAGAVIDEYYRLMFGAAAEAMKRFFEIEEEKWMKGAIGQAVQTSIGSVPLAPSAFKVWTEIYAPPVVAECQRLFAAAAAAVPADSLEGRRVALFKREFLDPIVRHAEIYAPEAEQRELARRSRSRAVTAVEDFEPVTIEVTDAMRNVEVYDRRFKLNVTPGKTYHVSYFLTCTDIASYPYDIPKDRALRLFGGVECAVFTGASPKTTIGVCGSGIYGNHRRMLQVFDVTIPDPLPPGSEPQIVLRLYNRTGKARFEDLLMECLE